MPPLDERLALAERTMTALVADAELPPKIGVHPRPDGLVRPRDAGATCAAPTVPGRATWSGIKWVAGFAGNTRAACRPSAPRCC